MPSKTLLESAHRWHDINRAREFCLIAKPVKVDMKCIQERKQHLIGGFAAYRRKQLRWRQIHPRARHGLVSRSAYAAGHQRPQAGTRHRVLFVIATGSVIPRVPVPGLWKTGCWTSDEALEAEEIPKRLAVLGGGVIAVELGQFFARVGSKTTILQRSERLVRGYDADVTDELERAFKTEGIDVRTGVKILEVSKKGKGKRIVFQRGTKREELIVDEILYAMGRAPALDGLTLGHAGIEHEDGKLLVNDHLGHIGPAHLRRG